MTGSLLFKMPVPFGVYDKGAFAPEISPASIASIVIGTAGAPEKTLKAKAAQTEAVHGPTERDPNDLALNGWAVIFAPGIDTKIREAIEPLIALRRSQVDPDLFKIFKDENAPRPSDSFATWLAENTNAKMEATVDPSAGLPYYVLIVAPPDISSFEFQCDLALLGGWPYMVLYARRVPPVRGFRREI